MKETGPYKLRLKTELIKETVELFSLFLHASRAFLNSNSGSGFPEILKTERNNLETDLEDFNRYHYFEEYINELHGLDKEEVINLIKYYKDGLTQIGQDYGFIINTPEKTPLDHIKENKNSTLKNILLKAWQFGDDVVRTGIVNYLDGLSNITFDHNDSDSEGETTLEDRKLTYHINSGIDKTTSEEDLIKGALILSHELHHTGNKSKELEEEIEASIFTMKMLAKLNDERNFQIDDNNLRRQWDLYNALGENFYIDAIKELQVSTGKKIWGNPYLNKYIYEDPIWDTLREAGEVFNDIITWIWEVLQGEWNEDATFAQIIVDIVITLIPIVDTVGDVRDLAAHIYFLCWKKQYNDPWRWFALVLTLIGFIPEFGTVAKGIIRVIKNLGEKIDSKTIKAILKFGEPLIRKLANDLPKLMKKAYKLLCEVIEELVKKLKKLSLILKKMKDNSLLKLLKKRMANLDKFIRKLDEFISELQKLPQKASKKFDEAQQEIDRVIKKVLGKSDDVASKISTRAYNSKTIPCFPPGVIVKTTNGDIKIEDIKAGDMVRGFDFNTLRVVDRKVEEVLTNWTDYLAEIEAGDISISSTRKHRFWEAKEGQWVYAEDLKENMSLKLIDGSDIKVNSVVIKKTEVDTYNLSVEETNNYFVGSGGILVHNSDFTRMEPKPTAVYGLQYTGKKPITVEVINRGKARKVTLQPGDMFYVGKSFQGGGDIETRYKQHLRNKAELDILKGKVESVPLVHSSEYTSKGWTNFETACWEQHFMNEYGGAKTQNPNTKLFNSDRAIQETKYMEYRKTKYKHNPCP